LKKWKQKLGSGATYSNLIKVFEQAGHKDYSEIVKHLVAKNVQTDTNRNAINQTPPPPSQQLPIFPSESVGT
jgi:rhamnogalacturonyl hydrolase YesR